MASRGDTLSDTEVLEMLRCLNRRGSIFNREPKGTWTVCRLQAEDDTMTFQNSTPRKRVGDEGYELRYLSERTGISIEQARVLLRLYGADRSRMEQEALKLRATEPR